MEEALANPVPPLPEENTALKVCARHTSVILDLLYGSVRCHQIRLISGYN